jgi:hypothetical protein
MSSQGLSVMRFSVAGSVPVRGAHRRSGAASRSRLLRCVRSRGWPCHPVTIATGSAAPVDSRRRGRGLRLRAVPASGSESSAASPQGRTAPWSPSFRTIYQRPAKGGRGRRVRALRGAPGGGRKGRPGNASRGARQPGCPGYSVSTRRLGGPRLPASCASAHRGLAPLRERAAPPVEGIRCTVSLSPEGCRPKEGGNRCRRNASVPARVPRPRAPPEAPVPFG